MLYQTKKRKLNQLEINQLVAEIRKTPFIVSYSQKEWQCLGKVFVLAIDNNFAGACATLDLGDNWFEIAAIYVLEKFRRCGGGKALFETAFRALKKAKRNIYIVSRNPVMIRMMRQYRMKILTSFWQLPWPVKRHSLKLIFNFRRIFEFIRKSFRFGFNASWIYGIQQMDSK